MLVSSAIRGVIQRRINVGETLLFIILTLFLVENS